MSKPSAMVIEDDSLLGEIFMQAVKDAGYEPILVADGAVASHKLGEVEGLGLIVLDLHLPHVDGTRLLDQIREQKSTQDTPVIIASADDRLARLVERTANYTLAKPVSYDMLKHLASRIRTS